MARIFLVSCASHKRDERSLAKELYVSPLFIKSKALAGLEADSWYILSAKHGLLHPDAEIDPYDRTLNRMTRVERQQWADQVVNKLTSVSAPSDQVTMLAGSAYREMLLPQLTNKGYAVAVPMFGLSIGNQLRWLNQRLERYQLKAELNGFYDLLQTLERGLGGKRRLGSCEGKMKWPTSGVYL